jgi:hypothetical protein
MQKRLLDKTSLRDYILEVKDDSINAADDAEEFAYQSSLEKEKVNRQNNVNNALGKAKWQQ